MEFVKPVTFVLIPQEDYELFKQLGEKLLGQLKEAAAAPVPKQIGKFWGEYLSVKEYMDAVKIKCTKFGKLKRLNKIKTIKRSGKIHVPVTEIKRYFEDPSIT